MATVVAEYYTNELEEWSHSINFYEEEAAELGRKLEEVISRDGIAEIAVKVEELLKLVEEASDAFYNLQHEFQQQEASLKNEGGYLGNDMLNPGIIRKQDELRSKIEKAEKEYIKIKYDCYNFLSGIFKKDTSKEQ